MSREPEIVQAMKNAIDGITVGEPPEEQRPFRAMVGKFGLLDVPEGTVCIRPVLVKPTARSSTQQEYDMRILLGIRSRVIADDEGLHAFTQVCNDVGIILRALINSDYFKPGRPESVGGKLVREEAQYWYRPGAGAGEPGGAIVPVTVHWGEPTSEE